MTTPADIHGHWGPSGFDKTRKTIFTVHGAGGMALLWQGVARKLDPKYNVCALDLPGHGDTPGPGVDRIEAYASWVGLQIEKSGAAPVVLAGHSMGGAITLTLALERPELLAGQVLLATGARLRVMPAVLDGLVTRFTDTVGQIVDFAYQKGVAPATKRLGIEQFIKAGPKTVAGDFNACNRFDVVDRVAEVTVPTLILVGRDDLLAPPKYAQFLKDNIAGSRMIELEGCGHMAMIEKPDEVAAAMAEFAGSL